MATLRNPPSGRQLITQYLVPKAGFLPGYLARGFGAVAGYVDEGVDVFSASPDALPCHQNARLHGEVWGYFFSPLPADEMSVAPGGCWFHYGPEKQYASVRDAEAIAFRRRFAFHIPSRDCHGREIWERTRWLMKEYRLNKDAACFRRVPCGDMVNADAVVRKVFTEPVVPAPPPPPACYSDSDMDVGMQPVVPAPPPPARYSDCDMDDVSGCFIQEEKQPVVAGPPVPACSGDSSTDEITCCIIPEQKLVRKRVGYSGDDSSDKRARNT